MKAEIIDKKSGSRRSAEDLREVALDRPSVIWLKLSPENVARYERRADDLILILKDGQEIAIAGFFVKYPERDSAEQPDADPASASAGHASSAEARNELVLEDDNGVTWWGQYPEQWSQFHFTEIEWDHGAIIPWPWLLGALGAIGVGALALGSGGGNDRGNAEPETYPPLAVDDTARGKEDGGPVTGNLLTNDSDPDDDALSVTQFTIAGKTYNAGDTAILEGIGTITISSDGSYDFTPAPNWHGSVPTVTYTISDGKGGTDTAELEITIDPVIDLTAADDTATTSEDTPVSGTVATNDSTTSGGALTFEKASDPQHGTVVVNSDGTYTYTPDPNYHGPDSFTYTVTDPASGESRIQTVTITVTPVNDAPEANGTIADQASKDAEGIASFDASTFFSDVDGDALTYSASGLPAGLTIDPVTGVISGTIDRSASQDGTGGVHSVTVTATDGDGLSVDQTFTWTVTNPAPIANDDAATTVEDTAVSGNVLGGGGPGDVADSDPDGDSLSVTGFTIAGDPAVHNAGDSVTIAGVGTFALDSSGAYSFTPAVNWSGTVPTISYTISDGEGGTDTADLVITVTPVNKAPEANGTIADQDSTDAEGIASLDVSTFFSDIDGDALTYSASGLPAGLTIDPVTGVISGTIDRSASQDGAGGVHSVTVTATDGGGLSAERTFTWTVTNPAPIANDDAATTDEDTAVSGNVLGGGGPGDVADSDPDGDSLSVTGFTIAGDPAAYNAGDSATIAGVGTFTLGSSGAYSFTPADDWNGIVPTISYTISDGEGGTATADLVITVTPVNDAPEANGTIADQASKDAEDIASFDASTFFSDVDGDALTYSASGLPAGLTIDPVTGVISGTIDRSASQDGTGGVHSVTVTATDGGGLSVDQTFTWTVTNPAPIANDDAATTDEDTAVSGNVLGGGGPGDVADSDPDGDSLSVTGFTIAGDPTAYNAGDSATIAGVGTFTLDSTGAYSFTPAKDWNGIVPTVTYTVSDGEGGTDTADLVITVTPVNDDPTITGSNQSGQVIEAGNLDNGAVVAGEPSASGSFSASDADGDTLTWSVRDTADTTYGQFSIDPATGDWTYTLDNDLPATQALNEGDRIDLTFDVEVADGNGGKDTRKVTITIIGTNDSPIANADTGAVVEAGVEDGNTPAAGIPSVSGDVLANDTDVDDGETATLTVSDVSFGGSAGVIGSALTGAYGSLLLNSDGTYTYTLDNDNPDTQALRQGQSVTETFTYTIVDANGATSSSTLTITVTGSNDQPLITSTAADATGEVTEQGTANPAEPETITGRLTAIDPDADATQVWSLEDTNGTYGTISIDPDTGEWTYTLDNTRPATQALNDDEVRTETFIARVTDEHGAYSEQVITITVNGSNDDITGTGNETVSLAEDGSAVGTLQDYVSDVDNDLTLTSFSVDADGDGIDETYAPGDTVTLRDGDGKELGQLTIGADGAYRFEPAADYGGEVPTVTYTMAEVGGGQSITQTIDFNIAKVADAPDLEADKTIDTSEDTAVSLDLLVPEITDTGTGAANNDHPERLGAITLTIGGAGASGVTLSTGGKTLTPVGGVITIVLTDGDHVTSIPAEDNANGIYYLTISEYEALIAHPAADSGNNFTVTVSATSYEVDADGAIIPGVDGATSTQIIDVDVQAVTDGATLTSSQTSLTFAEDSTLDLSAYLTAARDDAEGTGTPDADGSELYSYTVSGLPAGTIVNINGTDYTVGSTGEVTSAESGSFTAEPKITITPPADFSGDIDTVTITLNTRDTDSDSSGTITPTTSSVTLDLRVTPVAGDVSASDVTTSEDTAVAFLAGVTVTDKGTTNGTEVINSISFEVPTGWLVTEPAPSAGWSYDLSGTTATITFDDSLPQDQREAILDGFTILPPPHSSLDETITLSITSTDTNGEDKDTQIVDLDVTITVTPEAEQVGNDSDGDGGSDVTMNDDHAYSVAGKEDAWFALGTNYTDAANSGGGFAQLATPWFNADANEFTYAVLTPTLAADDPGDTVIGTQFRYSTDGGATWETQTYVGEPLWVPAGYLDTLQVKLPPDVSGTLTIGVQAGTVDYDDDADRPTLPLNPPQVSGPDVNVKVSGSATLSTIKFDPVADAVTMALNGRASGFEDSAIPLSIRTTSSDASETFNVTISDIPVGATITYGTGSSAVTFTATAGNTSFEILNFSNSVPITVTPPENSNDDFTLTVSAVSVDGTDILATPVSRTIDVSVTGVADVAVITMPSVAYTTTEAALDSGDNKVALSNLVTSVSSADDDGSEVATLRITGLPEDFSLSGATAVVSGTGTERVWIVSASDLANVSIIVPENFSGTVSFKVAGVTTENDGDSLTGPLTDVSFTVTPSPEATITPAATLVEDEVTLLNLAIVQQNGETNETLGNIYVPVNYDTSTYTLHLDGVELSAAGLSTVNIDGVDYYVIPPQQIDELGAKGAANLDGDVGALDFLYEVTDPSSDGTLSAVTEIKSGTLDLTVTPVTDPVDASITAITMTTATGTATDDVPADDAAPDTATVTGSGAVTVNLHVESPDGDGSEHLIRVLIEGVPDGVTVTGGSYVGAGLWVLVYDAGDALAIGSSGLDLPVEFVVGLGVSNGSSTISMTVQAQDRGDDSSSPASIQTDSVNWNLVVDLADGEIYAPPIIDDWSYNGMPGTEDAAFTLDSVIDAAVSVSDSSRSYSYTVTVTDLPPGSVVNGMALTMIEGAPTWTATVIVPAGGDSQAALDSLLSGISITPPDNSNDNNADFSFDAKLTAAAVGGTSTAANTSADMPVTPVTDEASITVITNDVDEGAASVTATIAASNPADGAHGTIVDGKIYVQLSTLGNEGGVVTDGSGQTYVLTPVSGVHGVPDGNYYVIEIGEDGGSVDLTYTIPDGSVLRPGDVTFTVYAQTQETNASTTATGSTSGTAGIMVANNGVTVESQSVTGAEAAAANESHAIELVGLAVALNDDDGSETIRSILLSGVPVGFLLYVGNSAGDATLAAQASNAGGDGATNTWVLSSDGTLPPYVAILPATNWSGTLDGLSLVVESGETSLTETRVDSIPLGTLTVEAVANGLTIDPTLSFGTEGRIIALNLNAAMADAAAAAAAVPDASIETTTLQITGLGAHAAFYIGDELVTSVSYDAASDSYTITGLSQDDLDDLGFIQAASALTDQDAGAAGTQITITAWTVESATGAESSRVTDTLTVSVAPVMATTGDDSFIWDGRAINGRAGTDTVTLRLGEDVTNDNLADFLKNIEIIDLSAAGENSITGGLSVADVLTITGSSSGTLTIDGDGDDRVELSSAAEWTTDGIVTGGYVTYTSAAGVTLLIDEDIYNNNHVSYAA